MFPHGSQLGAVCIAAELLSFPCGDYAAFWIDGRKGFMDALLLVFRTWHQFPVLTV